MAANRKTVPRGTFTDNFRENTENLQIAWTLSILGLSRRMKG